MSVSLECCEKSVMRDWGRSLIISGLLQARQDQPDFLHRLNSTFTWETRLNGKERPGQLDPMCEEGVKEHEFVCTHKRHRVWHRLRYYFILLYDLFLRHCFPHHVNQRYGTELNSVVGSLPNLQAHEPGNACHMLALPSKALVLLIFNPELHGLHGVRDSGASSNGL